MMVLTQMMEMTSLSLNRPLGLQKLYCTKGWNVAYILEKLFFSQKYLRQFTVIFVSANTDSYQIN
jgi:hypothetical protein